jgi:KDO2-lipid IV(A) lauroyltransferase
VRGRPAKHAAEYALFRAVSALLRAVPESWALSLGAVLGHLAGSLARLRRRDVDANLRLAFPERSVRWQNRVARASYRHLGREAVAVFRLADADAGEVVDRTEVQGLEEMRAALAAGRGVVLVAGHLGNWEIGGAALASRGIPVDAVSKAMANRRFDADLVATRERLGMTVVDMADAPRAMLRTLRRGRVAALVADQNARVGSVFVPFFDRAAFTARGPALFALRADAPLFLGVCLRVGRRPSYRVTLRRIEAERTGDLDEDVLRLTAAHVRALEEAVRAAPEQYFWQHKRWKTRPPEEPPPEGPV